MNKMDKLINWSDKVMTDGKSIVIMCLIPFAFLGVFRIFYDNIMITELQEEVDTLNNRVKVCDKYIKELESVIEINDICLGDVCGGDGYDAYYTK